MARMHSHSRGRAGSKRPLKPAKPTWVRYKPKEVELLVGKLAKEGKDPAKIGLILRDSYGVPDVQLMTGKRVTEILAEKNLLPKLPEDLTALMKKSILVRKHLEKNKHDMPAKRGLQLTESKIKRLVKYYKKIGRLAPDWKYDPKKLKLFVE